MTDFGRREQHRGSIRARGNACSTTDACSRVHRQLSALFWHRHAVGFRGTSSSYRNVATCLDNAIECAPINNQVLDNGKRFGTPRLESELVTIVEVSHVKLTRGGCLLRAMRAPVDDETASSANPFATITIEGDRIFALG